MRFILPTLLVTAGVALTTAQAQNVKVGAKAGLAVTNFVGDKDTDFEAKWNFVGGFPLSYPVTRNLLLAPEILYVVKGADQLAIINNGPAEVHTSVVYIEFPLLGRYIVSPRKSWSPIVAAGPVLSWKIDARSKYNRPGSDIQQTEVEDDVQGLDVGVAAGAGLDFSWDLRRIWVEIRYTRGLSNLTYDEDDPKHNGVVSLTAGIGL